MMLSPNDLINFVSDSNYYSSFVLIGYFIQHYWAKPSCLFTPEVASCSIIIELERPGARCMATFQCQAVEGVKRTVISWGFFAAKYPFC